MTDRHSRTPSPRHTLPARDHRLLLVVGAIAALVLVGGLVLRGTVALTAPPGQRVVAIDPVTGAIASGGIELEQDDSSPLFPDVHLEPGVEVAACAGVAFAGDVPLETVALRLDAAERSSRLLQQLHLRVERGVATSATGCADFVPQVTVADGRVVDLLTAPDAAGWASWRPVDGDRAHYRFTVVLPETAGDASLQGDRARLDFVWASVAATPDAGLGDRLGVLVMALLRDAVPPLLLLAVLAVLFLGVQDRIDRQDPKLALAAVVESPYRFPAADPSPPPTPQEPTP